jgi:osmotically-inducible protein OsmY
MPVLVPREVRRAPTSGNVIADAMQRLEKALHVSALQRVRVDFREGVLFLRGQARSYYHKQLIQESVRGIDGVERIVNSVDVPELRPRIEPHSGASCRRHNGCE